MLYVDLKLNEALKIGDVKVLLLYKSGKQARLAIEADPSITITQYLAEKPDKKLYPFK